MNPSFAVRPQQNAACSPRQRRVAVPLAYQGFKFAACAVAQRHPVHVPSDGARTADFNGSVDYDGSAAYRYADAGPTDFDPQWQDAKIGLPALPGQVTNTSK